MSGDWVGADIFFLVGFLRDWVLFLPCVCYNVCRGDGDLRIGAFVPRSHMLHLLTRGAVVRLVLLIDTASPHSCSILVVPLFLSPRPTNRVGGAISFAHSSCCARLLACLVG